MWSTLCYLHMKPRPRALPRQQRAAMARTAASRARCACAAMSKDRCTNHYLPLTVLAIGAPAVNAALRTIINIASAASCSEAAAHRPRVRCCRGSLKDCSPAGCQPRAGRSIFKSPFLPLLLPPLPCSRAISPSAEVLTTWARNARNAPETGGRAADGKSLSHNMFNRPHIGLTFRR